MVDGSRRLLSREEYIHTQHRPCKCEPTYLVDKVLCCEACIDRLPFVWIPPPSSPLDDGLCGYKGEFTKNDSDILYLLESFSISSVSGEMFINSVGDVNVL